MIGEVIRSGLEFQSDMPASSIVYGGPLLMDKPQNPLTDATAPKPSMLHIIAILKYHQANAGHDLTHESTSVNQINIY